MLPSTIQKIFVSTDVTFNDNESYFPTTYLQGENSIKEDKDWNSYLIDPFLIDPPKVIGPVSVPSVFEPESSSPINPIPEPKSSPIDPALELESSPIEPALENRMTSKAYSRKKVVVPRLI